MDFVIPDFAPAAPEIFLLVMACVALVVDLYLPARLRLVTYQIAQVGLVGAAVLSIALYPAEPVTTFHGGYVNDGLGSVLKAFALLVAYFALFYTRVYLEARDALRGEYFVLALFAVLGMMVLISAGSLLTVYLGLELLALSLYAMVALQRDSLVASEAAMKYFVLGALASGMLLYGISIVYGLTGTIEIAGVREAIAAGGGELDVALILALVFVVVGIAFKLGAVPFHMWVPDVYQGAATPVTLFIGTAPKIAAFGMLIRLLVDGLGELHADWRDMLILLAIASMAVGNIVAISQTNLKRMLAYSTIAHVGFLLLGVIAGTEGGHAASMFYVITYALMALGSFGMIILLGRSGFEADRLDDFRGLNARNPWYAFLVLILMLSMAGVPPFLGFWAKWSVLRELVAVELTWLAVLAVALSVIGLFYYLRVVRLVYFEPPADPQPVAASQNMQFMISTNALAILVLGIYPGGLMAVCVAAFG